MLKMRKETVWYACQSCGHDQAKWFGRCPSCGEWNTAVNWAGGQAGRAGDIAYSVTGGLLTGAPVVEEAVNAIITTDGDVKLRDRSM